MTDSYIEVKYAESLGISAPSPASAASSPDTGSNQGR